MELADVIVKSVNSLGMIVMMGEPFEDPANLTPSFKNTQGTTDKSDSHKPGNRQINES